MGDCKNFHLAVNLYCFVWLPMLIAGFIGPYGLSKEGGGGGLGVQPDIYTYVPLD